MRKSNESVLDSDIYERLRAIRIGEIEHREAMAAMLRAEQIADIILWAKGKVSDVGHWFLKPSLRHY